jgi:phosphoribosylanthranilate isomerase
LQRPANPDPSNRDDPAPLDQAQSSGEGSRLRVKICGLTDPANVAAVVAAGADEVGLNFVPTSKRFITLNHAATIRPQLPDHVRVVGVFRNAEVTTIIEAALAAQLDVIQFHDETEPALIANVLARLEDERVRRASQGDDVADASAERDRSSRRGARVGWYRAFSWEGPETLARLAEFLIESTRLGLRPDGILLDTPSTALGGGAGVRWDWSELPRWPFDVPLYLAGGLTPDNVAEAVRAVRPTAVDVASGVESAPGIKDPERTASFIRRARAAADSAPGQASKPAR